MTEHIPKNWRLAYLVCKPEDRGREGAYQMAKRIKHLAEQDELKRTGTLPEHVALTQEVIDKYISEADAWIKA